MEIGSIVHSNNQLVRIVLCQEQRMIITAKPSGRTYEFLKAGHQMDVDEKDAEYLLGLMPPPSCCGGMNPTPYFELVRK